MSDMSQIGIISPIFLRPGSPIKQLVFNHYYPSLHHQERDRYITTSHFLSGNKKHPTGRPKKKIQSEKGWKSQSQVWHSAKKLRSLHDLCMTSATWMMVQRLMELTNMADLESKNCLNESIRIIWNLSLCVEYVMSWTEEHKKQFPSNSS